MPKFHCPRCRDHYYGLTPYPCDEELARLIREGLWRTGEGASPDKSIRRGLMRASLSETNIQKNRKSNNKDMESSSKVKLPPLNANNSNMTSSHDTTQGNTNGSSSTSNLSKKRSKKITFVLDNDSGASPSTSETSLSGHNSGSRSGTKGRKRRIGDESKKGSLGSNKGSLTGLNDTGSGSNSSLDRYRVAGHQKKSDNQSSTSKLIDSQTDVGILKNKGDGENSLSARGTNKDIVGGTNTSNNVLYGDGDGNDGKGKAKGLGDMANMDTTRGVGTNTSGSLTLIDEASMTDLDDTNTSLNNINTSNRSGSRHNNGNTATMGSKDGNKSSDDATNGGSKKCNVINCQNKIADFSAADGSKKAHKTPPGYMRAASPSQSDWGDPTHAKKWINNVAPPHPTFRYNNDNDDYDDNFSSQVFNPRAGWQQQKKPSKSDSDDPLFLPIGPTFTRAFTFSYMPGSSNMEASSSNSAAGGSKKSTRKKTT